MKPHSLGFWAKVIILNAMLVFWQWTVTAEINYQTIYEFPPNEDGSGWMPFGLTSGPDGNIYGATAGGGDNGFGSVFKISPDDSIEVITSFTDTGDELNPGEVPASGLINGLDGFLYGSESGGTIFKTSSSGIVTTLASSSNLTSRLLQAPDGNFYATTMTGGVNEEGSVIKIRTNGVVSTLYSFTSFIEGDSVFGATGYNTYPTPLSLGTNGNLYGVALWGGTNGAGEVFKITPAGSYTRLHSFSDSLSGFGDSLLDKYGGWPHGLTLGNDNNFYGVTESGGTNGAGVVFKITHAGVYTVLGTFSGNSTQPQVGCGPLIQLADGCFYGMSGFGGTNGTGSIYRVTPTGLIDLLMSFGDELNASYQIPFLDPMIQGDDDSLYGTTPAGANDYSGSVFRFVISPAISVQPTSQNIGTGSNVVFSVTASGTVPLNYQWKKNGGLLADGGNVTGASSANLTLTGLALSDSGTYSVSVTNLAGITSSTNVVLLVFDPPVITGQPTNLFIGLGTNAIFRVTATGTSPNFQWRKNGVNVLNGGRMAGATTANLTISSASAGDSGTYTLLVTNIAGSVISGAATLIAASAPVITVQPANYLGLAAKVAGNDAAFKITASGVSLNYQWLKDGVLIPGATASNYTRVNVQAADAGTYSCVVSNFAGIVITSLPTAGWLEVNPDLNSPVLSVGYPLANARITNGVNYTHGAFSATAPDFILDGIVTDGGLITNVAVQRIFPTVEAPVAATLYGSLPGKKGWTNILTLADGTNTYKVWAADSAGRVSTPITRSFFLVHRTALTVNNGGNGSHTSADTLSFQSFYGAAIDGAHLEIGRNYRIKANPGPNTILTNWTDGEGNVLTNAPNFYTSPVLTFRMKEGLVLNANFRTNPITAANIAGKYNGLFSEDSGVTEESAGFISGMQVRANGLVVLPVKLMGRTHVASGYVNREGDLTLSVSRAIYGLSTLTVALHVDWMNNTKQVTGMISGINSAGVSWNAPMTNDLAVWSLTGIPYPSSARFTMAIPPGEGAPINSPGGHGYAMVTNNTAGIMTLGGKTADGCTIVQVVPVSKNGRVPVYVNLYVTNGLLHGWLDFSSGEPVGNLNWIKVAASPINVPTNYPIGFTNLNIPVIGSPFIPVDGIASRPLATNILHVTLSDLNVGSENTLSLIVTQSMGGVLSRIAGASNLFSGSIVKNTGFMTMKFRPSNAGPVVTGNLDRVISGVVLQNSTNGFGAFNGNSSQTGSAMIEPLP